MYGMKLNNNLVPNGLLFEEIAEQFNNNVRVFRNVRCPDCFNAQKAHLFPFVVLTEGEVFPFWLTKTDLMNFDCSEFIETVDYSLRVFSNHFRIRNKFEQGFVLFCDEEKKGGSEPSSQSYRLFFYQSHLSAEHVFKEVQIADVAAKIDETLTLSGGVVFEESEFKDLCSELSKASSERRGYNDRPVIYFQQNPEKAFYLALFGGFLGVHRFYLKMFGTGLLYFFTLGLFGVGWFFDCLEILLGAWRKKGKKLSQVSHRKKHVVELLAVFGIVLVLIYSMFKF